MPGNAKSSAAKINVTAIVDICALFIVFSSLFLFHDLLPFYFLLGSYEPFYSRLTQITFESTKSDATTINASIVGICAIVFIGFLLVLLMSMYEQFARHHFSLP
jgi:uncharacterized membrane protein YqhA